MADRQNGRVLFRLAVQRRYREVRSDRALSGCENSRGGLHRLHGGLAEGMAVGRTLWSLCASLANRGSLCAVGASGRLAVSVKHPNILSEAVV